MKIFLNFIFIIFFSCFNSQNIKLYYELEFIKDTLSNNKEHRNMVFWIKNQNYIFCSQEILEKDSLRKNNLDFSPILVEEEVEFMIIKNQDRIEKLFLIDENLYTISNNVDKLNWNIKSDKKYINNIECQLATLKYGGRIWEGWFSNEYPITNGPYLFNGLPGAIIELKDKKSNYIFKLSHINDTNENIDQFLNKQAISEFKKPISVTKKQLNKIYLALYSDPFRRMKDKGIQFMYDEKTGIKEPPPDFIKMTKTAQKYIRENNNPIEISEAVKYE